MRVDSDLNSLAGAKKAAMLMMAIGDDTAAQLFSLMEEDEIRELSQHMANLGTASSDVIEDLLVDFADQISSTGAVVGNCHNTERMYNQFHLCTMPPGASKRTVLFFSPGLPRVADSG